MSKIALVEDDPSMRSLLKLLLELDGFEALVYEQFHEKEILAGLQVDYPDVLLLDVHLLNVANASGIEILRQIKQDEHLRNLRVIMVSGMDVRDQCFDAGADGFLLKPYMPDDLIALIRKQLSK